jgi:predicted RNA-binding protein YlqC (UPF0109 family)
MKELVEKIVRALVDSPEEVAIQEIEGTRMNILEIKVSKQDMGALIGKKGKNINALRTIVAAAGKGKRYMVEILGERRYHSGNAHFQPGRDRDIE